MWVSIALIHSPLPALTNSVLVDLNEILDEYLFNPILVIAC